MKKIIIHAVLYSYMALFISSCVDHRPIRNGLRDESIYLEKADLINDDWIWNVTVVKTSSPNMVADWAWLGLQITADGNRSIILHNAQCRIEDTGKIRPGLLLATTGHCCHHQTRSLVDMKMPELFALLATQLVHGVRVTGQHRQYLLADSGNDLQAQTDSEQPACLLCFLPTSAQFRLR